MPEVSRFYGIAITLNYDDHLPPPFHARYGEYVAAVGVGVGAGRSVAAASARVDPHLD